MLPLKVNFLFMYYYFLLFKFFIFVKWSFVLSTTHAKLVDCVTAIK